MKNNFAEIYSQHEALAARYNEASQKNDREGTVSYTHLDVYKRQANERGVCAP